MLEQNSFDVIIIGTGPAGLQAAIHAARKKVSVLLLGKPEKSSLFWAHVENFYAVSGMTGQQMLNIGREQAVGFGARFLEEDVLKIFHRNAFFDLTTESNIVVDSKTLIVATGTTRKKLGAKGEKEFLGRGVSYCVECDAGFFRDEQVIVVGNASAAVGGALTLLDYASRVDLVCENLDVTDALKEEIKKSDVIIHEGTGIQAIEGENSVEAVVLNDGSSIAASGVFIELGARGVMELVTGLGVQLDEQMKYIVTDKKMATNISGIFAAGDICGPPWQIAKAVGEGCVAGIGAANYAKKVGKGE